MGLPRKLKNFNLFQNGVSFMGMVPEVTLPKLSRKMEEYRAGGMSGSCSSAWRCSMPCLSHRRRMSLKWRL